MPMKHQIKHHAPPGFHLRSNTCIRIFVILRLYASSRVPNTSKQMKASGLRPPAVSWCLALALVLNSLLEILLCTSTRVLVTYGCKMCKKYIFSTCDCKTISPFLLFQALEIEKQNIKALFRRGKVSCQTLCNLKSTCII